MTRTSLRKLAFALAAAAAGACSRDQPAPPAQTARSASPAQPTQIAQPASPALIEVREVAVLDGARAPLLWRTQDGIELGYEHAGERRARAWTGEGLGEPRASTAPEALTSGRLEEPGLEAAASGSSMALANGWLARAGGRIGWAPSLARSPSGALHLAYDRADEHDFDVVHRDPDGTETIVAGTRAFEAHASVCVDARERVWLSWDEGEKDWGCGEGLHLSRRVRLAVREQGRWHDAPFELPASLLGRDEQSGAVEAMSAELPRLVADEGGPIWLLCRVMQRWQGPEGRGSFRQVAWQIRALALSDAGWGEPRVLPESEGANHDTLAVLALPGGGVLAAYESDLRTRAFSTEVRWDDRIGERAQVRALVLRCAGGAPVGAPRKGGAPQAGDAPREADAAREFGALRTVGRSEPPAPPPAADPDPALVPEGHVRLWGDLHRHSDLSRCKMDVDGSVVDQFRYALEPGGLDFVALTDHFQHLTPEAWQLARETSERFEIPGRFFALYGFERALPEGHRNLLCIDRSAAADAPFAPLHGGDTGQPFAPYADGRWIAIPHQLADRDAVLKWTQPVPSIERVVEIFQSRRGSYEARDAPRSALNADSSAPFVVDYLEQGRRFGVIASSDHESSGRAFAAVLARGRTREALFAALLARRCYAATAKIALDVRLGAREVGENGPVEAAAALVIRAAAGGEIASVVVVRNGRVAQRWVGATSGDPLLTLRVIHPAGDARVELALEDATSVSAFGLALESEDELESSPAGLTLASRARNRADEDGLVAVLHCGPEAAIRLRLGAQERRFTVSELLDRPTGPFVLERAVVDVRIDPPALGGERFSARWEPGDWKAGDWCYVRLARADGELAWSSPIWVE